MVVKAQADVPCNTDDEQKMSEEDSEDLVDPHDAIRECCAQKKDCATLKNELDECNIRVESRSKTSETCVQEIIDFMHCVEICAAKSLFSKLK